MPILLVSFCDCSPGIDFSQSPDPGCGNLFRDPAWSLFAITIAALLDLLHSRMRE